MEIENVHAFLESSPTIRLLRADSGAFVLCFLRQSLKLTCEGSAISLSHDELHHQLEIFQENLHVDGYDVLTGSPDRYLREWPDVGWLRRFLPADTSVPRYQLLCVSPSLAALRPLFQNHPRTNRIINGL